MFLGRSVFESNPRNHSVRKTCRKTRGKYAEYARNVKHGTMSPNSVAVRAEHDVRIQHGMVPWKVRNVRSDKSRVSKIKALVLGTHVLEKCSKE